MKKYLVGIDVGTTGVKAMVTDTCGNIIGSGYREYPCIYPKPGWVEQDAELIVLKTFEACKEAVISSCVDAKDIAAVGFSVQRATFGLADENNRLLGDKFIVWQDQRASSEMEYIKSMMPPSDMYKVCGHPITPTFSFEKIIWLMRNDAEVYDQASKIVFVSDYILHRFGAETLMCEVTNAGCSGMLDIVRLKWADHVSSVYGIREDLLPELVNPATVVGKVSKEIAQLSGLAQGTLLCTGSGDNQCGALGAGVTKAGYASMSLGTSGVLVVGSDVPLFEKNMGLMVNPSCVPMLYQIEGIQLGAASSYKWARDTIATIEKALAQDIDSNAFVLMNKHLKKSPVGANGLVFMPFLSGAGYPHWNTDAKGLFLGLGFENTRSDLIRSVMEGITLESKDMFENIKLAGVNIESVAIIGGAAKSPEWRQIIADMFNVPIKSLKVSDSTIIGAAILAGVGAGVFKDAKEGANNMVHFTDCIQPIPSNVKKYDMLYHIYKNTYNALSQSGVYQDITAYKMQ